MKLSAKIALSMGILALLMAGMGIYLIVQMSKINDVSTLLTERQIPLVENVGIINNAASEYRLAENRHIQSTQTAEMQEQEKRLHGLSADIEKSIKIIDTLIINSHTRQIFQTYLAARQAYRNESQKVLALSNQLRTEEAITALRGESRTQYNKMSDSLEEMVKSVKTTTDKINAEADVMYENSRLTGIILVIVAIVMPPF